MPFQALEGTAPVPPMRPGQPEPRTHDDKRNGTTDLFAALNIKTGTVVGTCKARHRAAEFRAFLDQVEAAVPADLDVHLVLDNAAAHNTSLVHSCPSAPHAPGMSPRRLTSPNSASIRARATMLLVGLISTVAISVATENREARTAPARTAPDSEPIATLTEP